MGLILLTSKKSSINDQIQSITYQSVSRQKKLQIQGLIVRLIKGINFGFVYCRSTPSNQEIKAIYTDFKECNIVMGDFNLSHRISEDQRKIVELCQQQKVNALNEITRSLSNNQLDYILIDEDLTFFVTSYNNFISDHKTIIARLASLENELTNDVRERLTFDQELHLKERKKEEVETTSTSISDTINLKSDDEHDTTKSDEKDDHSEEK